MRESKNNLTENPNCKVRLLDDSEISFDFKKETIGSGLLDFVCNHLNLLEKDYFSLRYVDNIKQRHWLKLNKEILKQLKDSRQPFMFFFRVKFYPTDPTKLGEEITRYQLYLQLKRDILHGRLLCAINNVTDLAAHIVQAELGDYNDEEFGDGYLKDLKLLPRQNEKLNEKIIEYHKTLKGCSPAEAENKFLNLAKNQDLYGVDPHPCKDHDDLPLYLGLTPHGIQVIREAKRVSGFVWSDLNKVSYDNKLFYIQTFKLKKKQNYVFCLNDTPSCKHLWKCSVEHMSFYSQNKTPTKVLKKSMLSPQSLFRKSKPKFSGKAEHELRIALDEIKRSNPPSFTRNKSLRLSVQHKLSKTVVSNNHLSVNDLEAIVQPQIPSEETNNTDMSTSMDSLTSSTQMNTLSEFKTEEFPDTESVCSSQDESDISFNSNKTEVVSAIHQNKVDFQSESVEASEVLLSTIQLKPSSIENSAETDYIKSPKVLDSFCNPLFVLILTGIIMIPLAVILNSILK